MRRPWRRTEIKVLFDCLGELLVSSILQPTSAPKNETVHNEPFEVHPDMLADAIMEADGLGWAWKKEQQ